MTRILHAGTTNSAFIGLYIAWCALLTSDDSAESFHKKTIFQGNKGTVNRRKRGSINQLLLGI